MKTKLFVLSFIIGLLYFACEDSTLDRVGMGTQPGSDYITVFDTIFSIDGQSVKLDSIYAKSRMGYLGKFYDPEFGEIKSGYMCQFAPSFIDYDSIAGDPGYEIDSVRLDLYYFSYTGDSLTPMEVTVYPITGDIEKNYYTNALTKDIVDFNNPWGKQTYTARNLNVSDSVNDLGYYYKHVTIPLPREIGQELYEQIIKDPVLMNKDTTFLEKKKSFLNIFKGAYFESTFGTGNIINVEKTRIISYYSRPYTTVDSLGNVSVKDSIGYSSFMHTNEVVLINSFENKYDEHLLTPNDTVMYMKTPGGVYSQISIPIPEIIEKLGKKKFSNIEFSITPYEKSTWEYALPFPGIEYNTDDVTFSPKLLLIPPDSLTNFFETQSVANSTTSYSTTYSSSTNSYSFSNISNIVQKAIEEAPDKDLKLLLVPIQVDRTASSSSYYSSSTTYTDFASYHYLQPSAVGIKKGGNNLQIRLVAADLDINQ